MKAHIPAQRTVPKLETILELNQKFGYGYQARMIMEGVAESVIDSDPLTLGEITASITAAIEEINRQTGRSYKPHKVIHIDSEALQVNKGRDFSSMLVSRDIERGRGQIAYPAGHDFKEVTRDGEKQYLISGRGVVLYTYFAWIDDKTPTAREALQRYCQYLAMHSYGGGASDIFAELDAKNADDAVSWLKATYGKYVEDDRALMLWVLEGK